MICIFTFKFKKYQNLNNIYTNYKIYNIIYNIYLNYYLKTFINTHMTPEGIEPPLADLESAALPLNYRALIV